MIEKYTGKQVKSFHANNGLEICLSEFNSFCYAKEIQRHLTVHGTPQQNCFAERMH